MVWQFADYSNDNDSNSIDIMIGAEVRVVQHLSAANLTGCYQFVQNHAMGTEAKILQ